MSGGVVRRPYVHGSYGLRLALMQRVAFLLLAFMAFMLASCAVPPAATEPTAHATPTAPAAASTPGRTVRPASTPPVTATEAPATSGVRARAVTLPTSYRLLPYAWGEDARLWLVDLTFQRAPEVAAWWKTGVDRPMVGFGSDGSRAVISAPSAAGSLGLHLIDLRTGAATPLLEEDGVDHLWPTVDRSGQNVAYVRRPKTATTGRADDGIWTTPIDRPDPRRIVLGGEAEARPWGWSNGDDWLAYTQDRYTGPPGPSNVHVVSADGSRRIDTEVSGAPEWHPNQDRLLITLSASPIGRVTSEIFVFDMASRSASRVYRSPVKLAWIGAARWSPSGDRFVFTEQDSRVDHAEVVVATLEGGQQRPAQVLHPLEAFWSSAGSVLVMLGGSDSGVRIFDVTADRYTSFCTRSDDPERCV